MIRTALEFIAISLFVAVLLMWAALLSTARAQFMQLPPLPEIQQPQWLPPPPPMQPMFQPPQQQPLQQTTTCYRVGINVVCTTR